MVQRVLVIIVAVIVLVVVAALGWLYSRKRRSKSLRRRLGLEYDWVVRQEGNVQKAEGGIDFRARRRERLHIRALSMASRSIFATCWTAVQVRFLDDPRGGVSQADLLVNEVMQARGYPVDADSTQRAADISVDHPGIVEKYRAAHDSALRHSHGQTGSEDLRKAMVLYRSLFTELLEDTQIERKEAARG